MSDSKTEGKTILPVNIWAYIILAIICWVVGTKTLLTFLESKSGFLAGLTAFFYCIAAFLSYRLLSPKFKFMSPGSQEYRDYVMSQLEDMRNDPGAFTYTGDTFTFENGDGVKSLTWGEIKTVIAFKEDKTKYDIISMLIRLDDDYLFGLNEETAGWYLFQKHLREKIKQIPPTWELTIATPAFQRNTTLLFDKENRSLEEILKQQVN